MFLNTIIQNKTLFKKTLSFSGNTSLCMAYHANTFEYKDTYYSAQKFKPECTNSGDWKAKQCKGGIGGR